MKTMILSGLFLSSIALGQTFDERIKTIQDFSENNLPTQIQETEASKNKINEFHHDHFLKKDEEEKKLYLEKANQIQNQANEFGNSFAVFSIKDKLDKYKKFQIEKSAYDEAKSKVEKANKNINYSNGLKKYIEALSNGQYTKANIQKALLNLNDKLLAEEYEKNLFYIQREANTYPFLLKEIKAVENQINYELSYPEKAIQSLNVLKEETKLLNSSFQKFQNSFDQIEQFDFSFKTNWDVGLFSCATKESPKYLRLKNYPDLILLTNEGNTKSVLKLDPKNPKQMNVIYKCKKMGMFGGCLDNKEKSLCQLDTSCMESLDLAMKSYDRKIFYPEVKNKMLETYLRDLKQTLADPNKVTILSEFEKVNRLGFYKKDELISMVENIKSVAQGFTSQTPEDFMLKLKAELTNLEKNEKLRLSKIPGFNTTQEKTKDTLTLLTYIKTTIESTMDNILNDDEIEKFSYQQCQNGTFLAPTFCENYKTYKTKVARFSAVEEVINAVPDECPRMVFRFEKPEGTSNDLSTCKAIDPNLNSNLENFILSFDEIQKKLTP
jgi:hypothetical protein